MESCAQGICNILPVVIVTNVFNSATFLLQLLRYSSVHYSQLASEFSIYFSSSFFFFLKQFEMFPISSPVRSSTPELHTKGAFSTCSQLHSPYNSPVRHLRPSNGLVSGSTINKLHPFEGYEVHTTRPCFLLWVLLLGFHCFLALFSRPFNTVIKDAQWFGNRMDFKFMALFIWADWWRLELWRAIILVKWFKVARLLLLTKRCKPTQ